MSIYELISMAIGALSLVLTWHFGIRKNRLVKNIKRLEEQLNQIEKYSSNTGYKQMMHDSFLLFSYVSGILLFYFGIKYFPINFELSPKQLIFSKAFSSGIFLGSAWVLLEHFYLLTKVYYSSESIKSLKNKIKTLENKKNEI